jgi:hypothetical protein
MSAQPLTDTAPSARHGDRASMRALAIMARYPRPGRVKTRLAATLGAEATAEVYRAFLGDLAARFGRAARRDGYTLVWAHTPDPGDLRDVVGTAGRLLTQRGDDLGERLYHVCGDLGAAGFREVVIISSDSPHLPATHIRAAFATLDWLPVVLGPAEDGGYSLVGTHTYPRPADLFRGIQMSTPRVLADTLARAQNLGLEVGLLPVTFDVDELPDLRRLAGALSAPGAGVAAAPRTHAVLRRLALAPLPVTDAR